MERNGEDRIGARVIVEKLQRSILRTSGDPGAWGGARSAIVRARNEGGTRGRERGIGDEARERDLPLLSNGGHWFL